MRYVVFLKDGQTKETDCDYVVIEENEIKFMIETLIQKGSFWKAKIISYEVVAFFNRSDIIGYQKL